MKYYQIPGTDVSVSAVVMGYMRIDALERKEIERLVMTALEEGINFLTMPMCMGAASVKNVLRKLCIWLLLCGKK